MNDISRQIRSRVSEECYQELEQLAKEQDISVASAVRLIIESYFDNPEKESLPAENAALGDPQQINTILQETIAKQDALVHREISYLRKVTDDMHKNNYLSTNVINSIMWKLGMEDQDYFGIKDEMNPIFIYAADDAEEEMSKQRERRLTNEGKYRKE